MYWQFTPYIAPLFIATIISLGLSLYAWRRRPVSGTAAFVWLALAVAIWSLAYALELGSVALESKIFWGKVQYLGIASLPPLWAVFALQYTNPGRWLTRRNLLLLAIIPIITIALVWTNEVHSLIWRQTKLQISVSVSTLAVSYGSWFWVHLVYSYILLILGTIFLVRMLTGSQHLYRWQSGLLLLGVSIPWLANAIYLSGSSPFPSLDLTPFAFALSCLALAWGLFRFRLLDIAPIARRAVVDSMGDGVVVLDTQDRVVDLNPAAQRLTGVSAAVAIGKPCAQVFANFPELVEPCLQQADHRFELVLDQADTRRYYDLQITPLYTRRQRLSGRLVLLRDITERKGTEKALILARDQALEASRLKTELLAKVSHELRTPLTAIIGYAEMLHENVYGPLSNQQLVATDAIILSAKTLKALVNDLLDQAQLESGQLQLRESSFSPADLVDQIQPRMRPLAEAKGLALLKDVTPDLPSTVSGDPARLQQILINLIGNAIKFTDEGTIKVRLFRPDEQHWAMSVSDTGPGIPTEAHSLIFEPFRQVDGSATREHGGTGLGLSIVKQLTILMRGQITLDSEIGQGSEFTIRLPLVEVVEDPA
jgi:PAS domain S-box-containing protein